MNNASYPQWWLKSHTFGITKTLNDYIQAHSIPEQVAEYLCFIQHEVIVGSNRAETDDQGYLRVSKNVWQNKCGTTYPQWLDLLASIGELEIDNSYHFLPIDASPEQQDNFIPKCKGFNVPYDKLASGLVKVDFKKKQVHPLKAQNYNNAKCESDPHIYYLLACLGEIRVVPEPTFPTEPLRYAMCKQYLEKTHYRAFSLHRAPSGRVFHSIIEMPREGRVNLQHSSGESLVDIDVKTCHPHLLLPLFTDAKEKQAFYSDLQSDIYTLINPNADRDVVKKRVCQYLMCKNRNAEWLANTDVHSYLTRNYPIFWKEQLSRDNGLAWYLQGVESQIVTRELVQFCMDNHYYIITMHDGCLTLERHKTAIMNKLKELLRIHTGYGVGVEEKQMVHNKPVASVEGSSPSFDFACIDTLYEMTDLMDAFKAEYEPLKKRANKEARRNYSKNTQKKDWRVWRDVKEHMEVLLQKYQEPIAYFAEKEAA
jgi:hypothetical protein